MVICLERGADLHMSQLMPLPLTVSCFSKIQIGFTFLVPSHLGSPGKRAVKRVCDLTDIVIYRFNALSSILRFIHIFVSIFSGLHVVLERLHIVGAAWLCSGGAVVAWTHCSGEDGTSASQPRQPQGHLFVRNTDGRLTA